MNDQSTIDAQNDNANRLLSTYVDLCFEVKAKIEACIEVANQATGAREVAAQRPQHEISIKNFEKLAEESEAEFPAVYGEFQGSSDRAKETAASITSTIDTFEGMQRLMGLFDSDALDVVANTKSILRSTFGSTIPEFLRGLDETNRRIMGEADSTGLVYVPEPAS